MSQEQKRISNPFPPICDQNSQILILGSLPSEASRAAGFYYMNPRNRFWQMLSVLLKEDLTRLTAEEKTATLLRHKISLSDVVLSCEIHRSADASIKGEECTDVAAVLKTSHVKHIFLNGGKAYSLFLKHFPQYEAIASCMPSTSPANAKLSLDDLVRIWGEAILPYLQ